MSKKFSFSRKSPYEFLSIMDRYGLALGDHTGGRHEPALAHLRIYKWYKSQYRAVGRGKEEYIIFLTPDYFLKTIKLTEKSLNLKLFV